MTTIFLRGFLGAAGFGVALRLGGAGVADLDCDLCLLTPLVLGSSALSSALRLVPAFVAAFAAGFAAGLTAAFLTGAFAVALVGALAGALAAAFLVAGLETAFATPLVVGFVFVAFPVAEPAAFLGGIALDMYVRVVWSREVSGDSSLTRSKIGREWRMDSSSVSEEASCRR